MLKDLKIGNRQVRQIQNANISDLDRQVAVNIVDILFGHILRCLQQDRSQVKLDGLTKGIIKSSLPATATGTKKYVVGMFPEDIKSLLNDIESELMRR